MYQICRRVGPLKAVSYYFQEAGTFGLLLFKASESYRVKFIKRWRIIMSLRD